MSYPEPQLLYDQQPQQFMFDQESMTNEEQQNIFDYDLNLSLPVKWLAELDQSDEVISPFTPTLLVNRNLILELFFEAYQV
jgi:hypothetical protein